MFRLTGSRLRLTIFLVGLAGTAAGLPFLRPRFAFLPVVLVFPAIMFGGRRNGDGSYHRDAEGTEDGHSG